MTLENITISHILLGILVSSIMSFALTPLLIRVAVKLDVVDRPIAFHKTHSSPVPYLGGMAFIATITAITFASALFLDYGNIRFLVNVILPPFILGVVGLIDDLSELSANVKFFLQNVVAVPVSLSLVYSGTQANFTGSRFLNLAITVLFLLFCMNSFNLFDNIDGGASTLLAGVSLCGGTISFLNGQIGISFLFALLGGSSLGFLFWNLPPAKIYLGDCGSLFIGSFLGMLMLRLDFPEVNLLYSFGVILTLVAVLFIDTFVVFLSRSIRGISPFKAGKDHLSHRLIQSGLSKKKSVLVLTGLNLIFGVFSYLIFITRELNRDIVLTISLFALLICLVSFSLLPTLNGNKDN